MVIRVGPQKLNFDFYLGRFVDFEKICIQGMNITIKLINKYSENKIDSIIIIESAGNFILFTFCGINIKIKFMKNIVENSGYLQWYHIYYDEVTQRKAGKLILTDYFDKLGNISKEKPRGFSDYSFQADFEEYFNKTLLSFCHKVDEETFTDC